MVKFNRKSAKLQWGTQKLSYISYVWIDRATLIEYWSFIRWRTQMDN